MRNDYDLLRLFNGECKYELDKILQRPYEWETDKLIKFITDIYTRKIKTDNGDTIRYNIGDFITYTDPNDITTKILFDGLQRTTTLMLLFANILHHGAKKSAETIKQILYATKWTDDMAIRIKRLTIRDEDDAIFEKILRSGTIGLNKAESKSCLARNYRAISNTFTNGKTPEELDEFFQTIVKNASYFERECQSRMEGIIQFNNLNGWHQSLKRSRLGIATLYAIFRDSNNSDEATEEFLCALSNMRDKDAKEFLALFVYYKGGEYKEHSFPSAFESLVKCNVDVVGDAARFYNTTYNDIVNCNTGTFSNPFLKIPALRQVYVDLFSDKNLWAEKISNDEKIAVYKKFEWAYVSNIVLYGGISISGKFKDILTSYNPEYGNIAEYAVQKLKDKEIFMDVNNLMNYKATNKNDLITRLLLRVESVYCVELNVKEPVIHVDTVTAEHIHPQNPRNGSEYHCDDNLTYSIGNFTLMGKSGNSSNSNKPFDEKLPLYKISPYLITSHHIANYTKWDNDAIVDNRIWNIERIKRFYEL